MRDATLRYVGIRLGLVIFLVIAGNLAMFGLLYADTFTPLTLPYSENFDQLQRLVYRQFGGKWDVQNGVLLKSDVSLPDLMAVIPLPLVSTLSYHVETQMQFVGGPKGGGLLFNMQDDDDRKQSQLVRFGVDPQGTPYLVWGYFDENLNFTSQGSVTPYTNLTNAAGATLGVTVHGQQYDIIVNGATVQANIPLQYYGGYVALTTWFSQISFDNVKIVASSAPAAPASVPAAAANAASAAPASSGELFSDAFTDLAAEAQWDRFSGDWTFTPGALTQTNTTGFDYGASAPGTFQDYTLRVTFKQTQGEGGGILFNMPQRDNHNSAQMVRFFPDNSLVWGYFDRSGNFQGQGSKTVTAAGTGDHTLEVRTKNGSYGVSLDGASIVENVPLMSQSGYIGLTASQSVVSFEHVDVLSADATTAAASTTAQGSWQTNGATITQQDSAATDSYSSTGISAENFNVAVQITAPDGADGGLAFGAASA